MDFFGIGWVASITVIAYLAGLGVKSSPWNNDHTIPLVCGLVGGVMGLVALYSGVQPFPAEDPITAMAVGIVSGLSATGVDQISKQWSSLSTKSED